MWTGLGPSNTLLRGGLLVQRVRIIRSSTIQ